MAVFRRVTESMPAVYPSPKRNRPSRPPAVRDSARDTISVMTSTAPNPVALRRLVHRVTAVGFGDATELRAGTLAASRPDLVALMANPALASVRLSWVSPGE